jgi:hypothetical protein
MAGRDDGLGSCRSRATGQCGCCTHGYLYGCSGSCAESPTSVAAGACSSRATGSCGCCNSGLSLTYVWYFNTCAFVVTDCPELPVHCVSPSFYPQLAILTSSSLRFFLRLLWLVRRRFERVQCRSPGSGVSYRGTWKHYRGLWL